MNELLPPQEARALAALDEARRAIEIARDTGNVAELLEWRDRAAAVQHYVRQRNEARAVADDAGEVKLRAERAIGELDNEANPAHRPKKSLPTKDFEPPDVSSTTRAMWRKLGTLDAPTFGVVVDRLRADERGGLTTDRAFRLAKELLPAPAKPKPRISAIERRMLEADELHVRMARMAEDALWLRDNTAKRFGYVRGTHEADRLRDRMRRIEERLAVVDDVLRHDHWEYRDLPKGVRR